MNVLAFISPTLPLAPRRQHSISISRQTPILSRLPPRATASKPAQSLDQISTYLFYTLTPLLFTNPRSTLAQSAESSTSPVNPSQLDQSGLDDSLTSRILGTTALALLVFASVGAIVVSINRFISSREDKKHRQWVQDRIDGRSIPKNLWSPDVDTTFPQRAGRGATAEKGMNRETRRMEKKIKDKEDREKKRKAKLAKDRADAKAKADKEQANR